MQIFSKKSRTVPLKSRRVVTLYNSLTQTTIIYSTKKAAVMVNNVLFLFCCVFNEWQHMNHIRYHFRGNRRKSVLIKVEEICNGCNWKRYLELRKVHGPPGRYKFFKPPKTFLAQGKMKRKFFILFCIPIDFRKKTYAINLQQINFGKKVWFVYFVLFFTYKQCLNCCNLFPATKTTLTFKN